MEHFKNRVIIETTKGPHHYINLDQVKRIIVDHKDGKSTAISFFFAKDDVLRINREEVSSEGQYWENIIRGLIKAEIVPEAE